MRMLIGTAAEFLVVLAMIGATAGSAQAQQAGNARHGLKLAREICSECHLVDKVAGRSANPAAPTFETIAKTPGLTSAALNSVLQSSHPTMPNIVIKGADARDIVAYILSLKDGD
jgi:mono/diheme cytochrome c family protein